MSECLAKQAHLVTFVT